jgi:hypothetical protein
MLKNDPLSTQKELQLETRHGRSSKKALASHETTNMEAKEFVNIKHGNNI